MFWSSEFFYFTLTYCLGSLFYLCYGIVFAANNMKAICSRKRKYCEAHKYEISRYLETNEFALKFIGSFFGTCLLFLGLWNVVFALVQVLKKKDLDEKFGFLPDLTKYGVIIQIWADFGLVCILVIGSILLMVLKCCLNCTKPDYRKASMFRTTGSQGDRQERGLHFPQVEVIIQDD